MTEEEIYEMWDQYADLPKILMDAGEDLERPGLIDTPERFGRMMRNELLVGYSILPEEVLSASWEDEGGGVNVCRNITFTSLCEHHLMPFFGTVSLGYAPGGWVCGLSKLARLVDCFARRLQIQERMTNQIADAIAEHIHDPADANEGKPKGVAVIVKATHLCCKGRGVKQQWMEYETIALRGDEANRVLRTLQC